MKLAEKLKSIAKKEQERQAVQISNSSVENYIVTSNFEVITAECSKIAERGGNTFEYRLKDNDNKNAYIIKKMLEIEGFRVVIKDRPVSFREAFPDATIDTGWFSAKVQERFEKEYDENVEYEYTLIINW